MDKKIRVILTGGGAPGIAGAIYDLQNNPEGTVFKIITTDINDDVVGKYLADKFYQVPPPENEKYIEAMEQIALQEGVEVIIPQTTREINALSKHREKFAQSDLAVIVSPYESIRIANDKFLLLERARKTGVPCPAYRLTDSRDSLIDALRSFGYPERKVVIKPRMSSGMRGLRILTEGTWDVKRFLDSKPEGTEMSLNELLKILGRGRWPELLTMEYLPGEEYTADVFRGKHGSVVIPRLRERIRSGITFDARVDLREDIIESAKKMGEALHLWYCFGFQFKMSEEGIPNLIECNPRVQGTMVASTFSGFNMIYHSVMEALGKEVKLDGLALKDKGKFKRYWGGVAVARDKSIGKV